MDQQPSSTPATGHPDTPAADEARGTPDPTVLSEGEWLAVSTDGFSAQQRGRPLEHLGQSLMRSKAALVAP